MLPRAKMPKKSRRKWQAAINHDKLCGSFQLEV